MSSASTLARIVRLLFMAAVAGVFLLPLQSQSQDVARAIYVSGRVSVIRAVGEEALFEKGGVHPKEIIVTGQDGYAQFQIADGSTFEVFPNSRVVFRDTFNWMDLIQVWLGRIRVQIEHRNGPNPKRVSTPTAVISVRGTVFDVAVEDDLGTTVVSVEEGQVGVQHRLQAGGMRIVNQNESIRVYPDQPLGKIPGNSPAQWAYDVGKRALIDIMVNRPGGVGLPGRGAGIPGTVGGGGAQGDQGKKNGGNGPGGAPQPGGSNGPGGAPPPPGGGH